jgi:hypothetical protein
MENKQQSVTEKLTLTDEELRQRLGWLREAVAAIGIDPANPQEQGNAGAERLPQVPQGMFGRII